MRALELYSGIGGFASAVGPHVSITGVDQSPPALETYRQNFPEHQTLNRNITGMSIEALCEISADLWWLSPPCQPYTVKGDRNDLGDRRAESFVKIMSAVPDARPRYFALENVAGFCGSRGQALLHETLGRAGYNFRERLLCPTELGVPSRRPRYYLVASQDALEDWPDANVYERPLGAYVDPDFDEDHRVPDDIVEGYRFALDIVDAGDLDAVTSCFTSAYGRSWVRSGSYLRCKEGIRLFTVSELCRLLHLPSSFEFPASLSTEKIRSLLGNSLSIAAVREVLRLLPIS